MLYILLFIFFLTALFAMLEDRLEEQTRNVMFLVVCFLAALAAGLRPDDVDHDYLNYVSMYYEDFNIMTEVSFLFISSLVHLLFDNYIFIFIIYAFLSLALNARALKIQTDLLFLSILVFFSTYYLTHTMNQIRVAVSCGIFLCSIPYLKSGQRLKYVLMVVCATLFHYSAFVLIAAVFFRAKAMSRIEYFIWCSIIPFCYLLYMAHVDPFVMIPIPYFEKKMEAYELLQKSVGERVNPFNLVLMVKIMILYFIIWKSQLIESFNDKVYLYIKIEILSISSLLLLSNIPVVAFRINELYGVVEILLFPLVFYIIRPNWLGKAVVVAMAFVLFVINVFYNQQIFV